MRVDATVEGCKGPSLSVLAGGTHRRLALVISTLTHGGAEMQVRALAERFARRGWQVDLIVLQRPEAFVSELRKAGVSVHSVADDGGRFGVVGWIRLVRLLRKLSPDVVHSHMRGANFATRLARPFANVPILVCTAHNLKEGVNRHGATGATETIYRLTDRLCDLTTNVSRCAVARYVDMRAAPAHRIRFVPNGIDADAFCRDESARSRLRVELEIEGCPVVINIGRFHPQKNHEMLVRAFADALHQVPRAVLLLVGSGELERDVRALVEELGIARAVRFLGIRNDIRELLSAADIYAMSSRYEGLPLVLLEAAACGLPVLATAVGGNGEIVSDGVTGYLVPNDAPALFRERLIVLLSMSDERRAGLGAAGRRVVELDYAIDRVVETWESLYGELGCR